MYFFTKVLHVGVVLHAASQVASSAILRGRSDADAPQLEPPFWTRAATGQLGDLNNQLDQLGQFLDSCSTSHRRPSRDTTNDADSVAVSVAKRQNIQIPEQALRDLLKLIQSIETQLTSIIAAGELQSSPAATAVPGASSDVRPSPVQSANAPSSNPPAVSLPASSPPPAVPNPPASNPVNPPATNNPDVGAIVPSPFLTSAGTGPRDPVTTAYGTATLTGTRCKTTLTQTFTAYVYEDGTPAGAPAMARNVESGDDAKDSDSEGEEQSAAQKLELEEPIVSPRDDTTTAVDELDLDGDEALNVLMTRLESRRSPDRSNLPPGREADDVFEIMH